MGNLSKNATMDPVLLFGITTKTNITSIAVPALTGLRWQKRLPAQAYKCIFRSENGCSSKKR